MPFALAVFVLLDLAGLGYTAVEGLTLGDNASVRAHFLSGVLTTILIVFTHSLVLFYLIGTGMDIREAVSESEALRGRFVPLTRRLKREVFPAACTAAALSVVAALVGADVHSRLISAAGALDAELPLRGVSGWWLHLGAVVLAVCANLWAFHAELRAVAANRRAIGEINRLAAASRAVCGAEERAG